MYRFLFKLVLQRLPAEGAHHIFFALLRAFMAVPGMRRLCARLLGPRDPLLRVRALGLEMPGPVGLAAGFDKDARGPDALAALGFGFIEVGTLTARAQPGNPRPRLFRLPADRALVNRMGFNNQGAAAAAGRLERQSVCLRSRNRGSAAHPGVAPRLLGLPQRLRRALVCLQLHDFARSGKPIGALASRARRTVVGANIGKSKVVPEEQAVEDYIESARVLAPVADYMVVNVSSPNTPGLRDLQAVDKLGPLLDAVRAALDEASPGRRVPLLVKIAPDLADADVDAVADLALARGLDGIIATNTTIARADLRSEPARVQACGAGGLSGAPLRARALAVLRRLRARVGDRVLLVAAGGIESGADAWARIAAGASLVQVYTGLIYGGPLFVWRLHRDLARRVRAAGLPDIAAAVGSAPAAGSATRGRD